MGRVRWVGRQKEGEDLHMYPYILPAMLVDWRIVWPIDLTGGWIDRMTDWQVDGWTDRQTDGWIDRSTDGRAHWHTLADS